LVSHEVMKLLCIIAFFVFAVMSIFSAKYRPLAKEAFGCVFKTITLRPCDAGMDDRLKAEVVSGMLKYSPQAARLINRHFVMISWIMVILTLVSFAYTAYGVYNFYYYGNCEGPVENPGVCILNDITGDYGRFSEPKDLVPPTNLDGIRAGDPDAEITIIEFGCFLCPYTGQAEGTIKSLLEKYEINYVFKPIPLPNHKGSYDAAIAVLCANKQNKQWELRQQIFTQQMICAEGGEMDIKGLAEKADLDMDKFNQCYDNHETSAELEEYIEQGRHANIYATPTFFINGEPLVGPKTLEEFEKIIEEV